MKIMDAYVVNSFTLNGQRGVQTGIVVSKKPDVATMQSIAKVIPATHTAFASEKRSDNENLEVCFFIVVIVCGLIYSWLVTKKQSS